MTFELNKSIRLVIAAATIILIGCEPKPISELSAEDGIMRIRERHSEKSWEMVVQDVNEYRARHPYSQYANDALLLQADAQYQSARYPEALVAYEEFLQKNRTHPKLAMAAFRVAKCYDFQSSEEPDREQDVTYKAVQKYNEYLVQYPKGEDATEARERMTLLRRRTADHDLFIARFYWKRELWHAALGRFLKLRSSEYKDIREEATQKAKEAYRELAKILAKDPQSDAVVWFKNKTAADLNKAADEL